MKKFTAIIFILALTLSLTACSKIRDPACYSVQQYGDGWSILYTDEEGVEEIAAMGSYEQPLALEKGRFYFVQDGKMVSVDPDGEDRQEVLIDGMPENALITFVDEANFYCLADRNGTTCWRISKTDTSDFAEVVIPYAFRPQYYRELEVAVHAAAPALEDRICVRGVRAVMDGNGSLLSVSLDLLCYDHDKGFDMQGWRTCRFEANITLDGIHNTTYINDNLILSFSDSFLSDLMTLEECIDILEDMDTAQIAAANAQGTADSFRLVYQADEYEEYVSDNSASLPHVNQHGTAIDASQSTNRFVLAQVGGCDTVITDRDGTACGNPVIIHVNF